MLVDCFVRLYVGQVVHSIWIEWTKKIYLYKMKSILHHGTWTVCFNLQNILCFPFYSKIVFVFVCRRHTQPNHCHLVYSFWLCQKNIVPHMEYSYQNIPHRTKRNDKKNEKYSHRIWMLGVLFVANSCYYF